MDVGQREPEVHSPDRIYADGGTTVSLLGCALLGLAGLRLPLSRQRLPSQIEQCVNAINEEIGRNAMVTIRNPFDCHE